MQKLMEGIHKFQKNELGRYQELFHRLSREGQNPHTLFITCCDSRVLAELITQSPPGDLFVVKNLGNIIPDSKVVTGSTNSTAAAIEFAVETLGVSDVVVCGHSQCGAMSAMLHPPPEDAEMPHLREWLKVVLPVKKLIEKDYHHLNYEARLDAAAEENVLYALENLQTYPGVSTRLEGGTLRLHGWFFKIATAELFAYDPISEQFQLIKA